jgi:hypothetical protein
MKNQKPIRKNGFFIFRFLDMLPGRESSVKKMPIEFGIFSERVGARRRARSPGGSTI